MFHFALSTILAAFVVADVAPAERPLAAVSPATANAPPVIAPRNPRRPLITAPKCESCEQELSRLRKPGGEFEKLRGQGWKIGDQVDCHLQIVDRADVGEVVAQLATQKFPVVACIGGGKIVRSFQSGCTTPLDAWTFGWLAKGINERPIAIVPEKARVETTGHYPLRGNHWSIDEDWTPTREKVIAHLRGPTHSLQVARFGAIESWSYEELRSMHDNLHEQEMGGVSFATRGQPAGNPFSATRKAGGK